MLQERTVTRNKEELAGTRTEIEAEVNRLAMTSIAVIAGFAGAWTLARLAGALMVSGSPLSLVRAWFSAVTGM